MWWCHQNDDSTTHTHTYRRVYWHPPMYYLQLWLLVCSNEDLTATNNRHMAARYLLVSLHSHKINLPIAHMLIKPTTIVLWKIVEQL